MNKNIFLIIASICILLSFSWILITPVIFPGGNINSDLSAVHKGFRAPDFTLQTPTGEMVSLSEYRGQPVLVFFWASWCSVCKRTMPGLQSVYEDYTPSGFEILAINTTYQDTLSSARNYFSSQRYTYMMLLDETGDISQTYQLHAVPLSVLINPDGEVHDVVIGSGMSEGYLRAYLNNILAGSD